MAYTFKYTQVHVPTGKKEIKTFTAKSTKELKAFEEFTDYLRDLHNAASKTQSVEWQFYRS
jgi:hypothetical protein